TRSALVEAGQRLLQDAVGRLVRGNLVGRLRIGDPGQLAQCRVDRGVSGHRRSGIRVRIRAGGEVRVGDGRRVRRGRTVGDPARRHARSPAIPLAPPAAFFAVFLAAAGASFAAGVFAAGVFLAAGDFFA